jgi:hypothetical protein
VSCQQISVLEVDHSNLTLQGYVRRLELSRLVVLADKQIAELEALAARF